MPFGIGHWELVILGVVLLLLFGSGQIPRVARMAGRSVREVRKPIAEVKGVLSMPLEELDDDRPAEKQAENR